MIHEFRTNDLVLHSYGLGGLMEQNRLKGHMDTFEEPEGVLTNFQGSCNHFWYL